MKARAPGKLVLSGAYAVLYGAPGIVSAVDRYAIADSSRAAELVTPEVRAAIGDAPAPWFDASALRGPRGKLGLGSSAAILVASLAAITLRAGATAEDTSLGDAILETALEAHRAAQGGGSGIDVACATRGGTLVFRRTASDLSLEARALPSSLSFEVWAGGQPVSTAEFVQRVAELETRDRADFARQMATLTLHAEDAARALAAADGAALLSALGAQRRALGRLGESAGVPIVTQDIEELAELAEKDDAVVIPSGAGGGDVALYAGPEPPSPALVARRNRLGHERLELTLGARGVHAWDGS
ncbi:MAG: hypothetical protein IPI67_25135 [Myxococcales bacterium]|nr:hypothetical protein [Myxococcales bacterium]